MLATLLLSFGIPLLLGGDEFGRTQGGNNNAYCQDNEISWVDWRLRTVKQDLLRFVQLLARLRREHAEFRRETFLKGATSRASVKDVTWLRADAGEMKQGDWQNAELRTLGIWFGKRDGREARLLLLLNAGATMQTFVLPAAPAGQPWIRHFDTAIDSLEATSLGQMNDYRLDASSAALLEC